jgi:hypothetical protein
VFYYLHKLMFMDLYNIRNSDYWLAKNERLEDRATNNRLARDKVYLIFLIRKPFRASKKDPIVIQRGLLPCIPRCIRSHPDTISSSTRLKHQNSKWNSISGLGVPLAKLLEN